MPDLPLDESSELRAALGAHELALVQMVTPVTEPARLAALCAASEGFVYAVTMTGTTGRNVAVPEEVLAYLDSVRAAAPRAGVRRLRHPQPRAGARVSPGTSTAW